jgi:hypothetical protein
VLVRRTSLARAERRAATLALVVAARSGCRGREARPAAERTVGIAKMPEIGEADHRPGGARMALAFEPALRVGRHHEQLVGEAIWFRDDCLASVSAASHPGQPAGVAVGA